MIRSTTKGIVVNKGKILLNKCKDEHHGEYYSLPGGGQIDYETMEASFVREIKEETGYNAVPNRFVGILEEICVNPNIPEEDKKYTHKMIHIFKGCLINEEQQEITETDSLQVGTEWVAIESLQKITIMPLVVGERLIDMLNTDKAIYLGSVNIEHLHG